MKIELNYSKEDLSVIISALNNAIFAVNDVYSAAKLGCQIPTKFNDLFKDKSFEEIDVFVHRRLEGLFSLYDDLRAYEQERSDIM